MTLTIRSSVTTIQGRLKVLFILTALLLASGASARDEGGVTPTVSPSGSARTVFRAAATCGNRLPAPFSGQLNQAC